MSKKAANVKRTSRTVISHLVVCLVGGRLASHSALLLKAIAVPGRDDLRGRLSRAGISCEMNWIDETWFSGVGSCDEISNSELMEIATAKSSCFQHLVVGDEGEGLESVTCGMAEH